MSWDSSQLGVLQLSTCFRQLWAKFLRLFYFNSNLGPFSWTVLHPMLIICTLHKTFTPQEAYHKLGIGGKRGCEPIHEIYPLFVVHYKKTGYNEINNKIMQNEREQNTHGNGEWVKIPLWPNNVGKKSVNYSGPMIGSRHNSMIKVT